MALHVAIDGPAASGKTTVARTLARRLSVPYLDTGAMYRALAWRALETGTQPADEAALMRLLTREPIEALPSHADGSAFCITIGGRDPGAALYGPDVSAAVSAVAAHPNVRRAMVERQREIAAAGPVVMAGRDIGTIVLPAAPFKFFLTASLDERVARRAAELAAARQAVDIVELRRNLERRDRLDATRAVAPLRAAPDAVQIDSTGRSAAEVLALMLELVGQEAHR
ncbi:MAG: (d)CMP kinase [Candidatus Eremiobacteraeota bacterium]|nr:(d)CMP kinase [Candidatus Eremiobacteraeota bacterium]MBC5804494.1 (d)CMP kinase [Candidatus Eremiobacteraeota bacterium]MBC5821318.1 (d)CMP kinase [Candidatus Eremiobacteraeota bacterium]